MSNKNKVYATIGIGFLILVILIATSTYFGLRDDPERVAEVKEQAVIYLEEHFDEEMNVVDVLHDNASIYEQFNYAAIVQPADDPDFEFLVYQHRETGEYTDSYVAEVWEDELEAYLIPQIEERFGEDSIQELWLTYPKDIGMRLDLSHENVPSLEGQEANAVIRLTLARGEEDSDEAELNALIEDLKSELNVDSGHITLAFSDNAFIFKDKNINESF